MKCAQAIIDPFTLLLSAPALQAAGLAPALSDRSLQATVFAPTDAAFADALAALDVSAQELAAQPALLAAVRGRGWVGKQAGWPGWEGKAAWARRCTANPHTHNCHGPSHAYH